MSQTARGRRGDGRIYRRGGQYWLDYHLRGQRFREPGGPTEQAALRKLRKRMKEIHGDQFVGPAEDRITVEELADNLILHLQTRGAKAVPSFRSHLKPVRDAFGLLRAVDLTTKRIEQFVAERQTAGKAAATINRETGVLRQAFRLARRQGRLSKVPYFPMLHEDNVRRGFFERDQFEAVAANLPDPVADIARFAYTTGWRRGEILPLRWEDVDRGACEIRLATSKNGRGRVLPYTTEGAIGHLIERRWKAREFERPDGTTGISVYVFHRQGSPIVDLRKAWAKACAGAKVPGRLFHDLRRTGVRDMTRAGVPQTVAMAISGHRTLSVFLRYDIASEEEKREALVRTEAMRAAQEKTENVLNFGRQH